MKLPDEPLTAPPIGSSWGRNTVRAYLAIVAVAAVLLAFDLAQGRGGAGSFFISVLTAPWSALIAPLAASLRASLGDRATVMLGLLLAAGCIALNARIAYGIAARMQRDATHHE